MPHMSWRFKSCIDAFQTYRSLSVPISFNSIIEGPVSKAVQVTEAGVPIGQYNCQRNDEARLVP